MKEHEHTANHEPAEKPGPGEVAKDAGSKHPAHHGDHAQMAVDFRKRLWISLVLTLPIHALSPMLQSLVGLREAIRFPGDIYVLFGLSSAVFWYGGWPTAVRSGLVALAFLLTICTPVRVLYAQPARGDHTGAEGMMSHTNGWMGGWAGGGMWLWTVIGVLVVVLLVVVIAKLFRK